MEVFKNGRGEPESESETGDRRIELPLLALKMEGGPRRGTQVASRSWNKQEWDSPVGSPERKGRGHF